MPLIQTKTLIPKERKNLLRRPRLVDFLHEHIDRQLIIVAASAGYGKTSLLVDYANDTDLPVCWYSLDENDRDSRDFLEYFVASIEQAFPQRLSEARLALQNWADESQGEAFAGLLVNEILRTIPDFFVIVLDDYHLVDDIVGINLFLDAFLRHQPDNCRIIICSRTIPTLTPRGMALLVSRQQIAGLGVNDLRFTADEIRDLIQQNYGETMGSDQAEELARESEGWITAVLLTRHRLWKGLFADLIQVQGSAASLYEYLANEVFERLDPGRRQFLEATSILTIMSPPLCDALMNRKDSAAILEELEDRNLFTTRIERGSQVWYRYHRLFREFLYSKLQAGGAGREMALHIRSARFLESDGDVPAAIHHFLEAGAYRDAARAMDTVAEETYDAGRLDSLKHWIDALPEDVLSDLPRLAWFKAKILWNQGEYEQSLAYSDLSRKGYSRVGHKVGVAQALIEKSAVLRIQGRVPDAIACCDEALSVLQGEELPGRQVGVLAGIYRNLGSCHWRLGELQKGIDQLRKALELYEQAGYAHNMAQTHNDLGVLLRTAGNLSGSHYHFEQAKRIWERLGNRAGIASALNSMGVSYHMRGEYAKALDVYGIALQRAREAASDRLSGFVLAGMGDTYLAVGDVQGSLNAYEESQVLAERVADTFLSGYLLGAKAMAYLLRGDPTRALDLSRQAYERATEQGARQEAATHQIVLGAVYYQQGRSRRALDYLTEAEETLRASRANRDLARARLHLAMAYYRTGRLDQAQASLEDLTDAILDVGQDLFLVPEARMSMAVLEYAVERGIGGEVLVGLLKRAREQRETLEKAGIISVPSEGPATAPPLRIYALGDTMIFRGDEEVPAKAWGTVKARQLLLFLLSNPGQRKEQISDLFWPELPPAKVRSTFHVTTYRLRRALQMSEAIIFEDDRYMINRQIDLWYDVWEFDRLLQEADSLDVTAPAEAASRRREAVALIRGEFCTDLPEMEWQTEKRNQLGLRYLDALLCLAGYHLQQAAPSEALVLYRKVLAIDLLREDAHRKVMECLVTLGDRAGALKHYQEMEVLMREEVGAAPDPSITQYYRQIAMMGEDEPRNSAYPA